MYNYNDFQIIHRTYSNRKGNEFHHFGYNTCSSCFKKPCCGKKRDRIVLPCLRSDAVYVMDISGDKVTKPEIIKIIEGDVLRDNNVCAPHTSHCLPNGKIMISTMGDRDGNAKGDFIVFDQDFECKGKLLNLLVEY
jgi:selenium-binding protein 1